jgi:protein-L-isoaspartate(D-aspartate) O-methyltransferase
MAQSFDNGNGASAEDERRMQLVFSLRRNGVTDTRVLNAIEQTPRALFVERLFLDAAMEDTALPISCGQTISQPTVVGLMTQALKVQPRHRVLEIGTGSGYQAAVLARLCRRVYTIERHEPLAKLAKQRFEKLGLHNVTTRLGDGALGWPEQAPFDRIMITAAAEDPPAKLIQQLAPGGVMVAPLGHAGDLQHLVKITKTDEGLEYEELTPVRFVPLLGGVARE